MTHAVLGALLVMLTAAAADRVPVVVELFTSEGCSSCPPADQLIEKLSRSQPVQSAEIIVLSEHVDYWNHIGWQDPYSSPRFSSRQSVYGKRFGLESIYTPQMVIDGTDQLVGSDTAGAESAIARAAVRPKVSVKIVSATRHGNEAVVQLQTSGGNGEVWVAVTEDRAVTEVRRGENAGRTLGHVSVVRALAKAGTIDSANGLAATVHIPGVPAGDAHAVVFVQSAGQGRIDGAASAPLLR